MDISLDRDILQNLETASGIEWLEKNNSGIYSSSTAIGMNTRREHGLFVVPDNSLKKKVVLLSKFEESIFIENRLHEISANTYEGGVFPTGYSYLKKFEMNPFPRFFYEIEERIIEKTLFLLTDKPLLVVRYELKNQGSPLNLIIKPFLADRFSTDLTREIQGLNTDSYQGHSFVRWALKQNMPEVYVFYTNGEFIPANLWYKNFVYPMDAGKYSDNKNEHLFNPGFFQATLNPYQALDLYISTSELSVSELSYESIYRNEAMRRSENDLKFFDLSDEFIRLNKSLKKSVTHISNTDVLTSSILENVHTTRDIILSLPGLTLVNGDYNNFKQQYKILVSQISEGLLPVHSPYFRDKNHYAAADLSLWLINLGYTYYKLSNDSEFFSNGVLESFKSIFDYYTKGTINNIYTDSDGLIFAGNKSTSTSWIPLANDNSEVLRFGKMLEINALWFNAVKIIQILTEIVGKKRKAAKYEKYAEKIKTSFNEIFKKEPNQLYDFVAFDIKNSDFRINQIIPIILPFSPIEDDMAAILLEKIETELLTPFGLRSAAIKNSEELSAVTITRKTPAFYNGAIWPWTVDLFVSAALKLAKDKKEKAKYLKSYFSPLINQINKGLINYLPEAITYKTVAVQNGIADFSPSIACLIWSYFKLDKEINQ
ncbi:MAG: glycogen debranching enzyme N-terminal domain-containing protein [Calditrichaeota bacterium]|nr:glycogen debranching enzyme N-terminal domain-containing protein [Calditrichota bacterium]